LGGLKNGLSSDAYQVGIEENVNKEPSPAAAKQIIIENENFIIFVSAIFFN
jgi:hypothetical protein